MPSVAVPSSTSVSTSPARARAYRPVHLHARTSDTNSSSAARSGTGDRRRRVVRIHVEGCPFRPEASGAIGAITGVSPASRKLSSNATALERSPRHAPAPRDRPGGEQSTVDARQPDRIESRGAQRRHHLAVHGTAHDQLDHFRHLRTRDPPPIALLDRQPEPARQGADGATAAVHHHDGIQPHQRARTRREPCRAIELVAAQLDDPSAQHVSPAVSGRPSMTFMF